MYSAKWSLALQCPLQKLTKQVCVSFQGNSLSSPQRVMQETRYGAKDIGVPETHPRTALELRETAGSALGRERLGAQRDTDAESQAHSQEQRCSLGGAMKMGPRNWQYQDRTEERDRSSGKVEPGWT